MKSYLKAWIDIAKTLRPYTNESGSEFKFGISPATLTGYIKRHPAILPITFTVNDLTELIAFNIYKSIIEDFQIEEYPFPLDLIIFDMFIQHNSSQVAITLQRTINTVKSIHNETDFVDVNGKYTPYLIYFIIDFVKDYSTDMFALELINRRYSWLSRIASRKKHTLEEITDWLFRLHKLHSFIYGNGRN